MRVMYFLFAMYVLTLSVYPCSDKEMCADEGKAGIAIVSVTDHNYNNSEVDQCTPFCICACCAANIQLNHQLQITFSDLIHNTQVATLYFERPLLNNAKSIWQPPKI